MDVAFDDLRRLQRDNRRGGRTHQAAPSSGPEITFGNGSRPAVYHDNGWPRTPGPTLLRLSKIASSFHATCPCFPENSDCSDQTFDCFDQTFDCFDQTFDCFGQTFDCFHENADSFGRKA